MKITIPYGNFGSQTRSYDVIREYRGHFLFWDGELKIANGRGLILLRNKLNEHLPKISEQSFEQWVDWVMSLPDDLPNQLEFSTSGFSPTGTLYTCRTGDFTPQSNLPF